VLLVVPTDSTLGITIILHTLHIVLDCTVLVPPPLASCALAAIVTAGTASLVVRHALFADALALLILLLALLGGVGIAVRLGNALPEGTPEDLGVLPGIQEVITRAFSTLVLVILVALGTVVVLDGTRLVHTGLAGYGLGDGGVGLAVIGGDALLSSLVHGSPCPLVYKLAILAFGTLGFVGIRLAQDAVSDAGTVQAVCCMILHIYSTDITSNEATAHWSEGVRD